MNAINRVLVVLFGLLLLAVAGAVLLSGIGLFSLAWAGDRVVSLTDLDRGRALAVCIPLFILGLMLLYWELRPRSARARRVTLKEDGLGRVTVARDGVNELIEHEAAQVNGIVGARSHIDEAEAGIRIDCRVAIDPKENLPERAQELRDRLAGAVGRFLGQAVAAVNVEARVAQPNRRRPGARVR